MAMYSNSLEKRQAVLNRLNNTRYSQILKQQNQYNQQRREQNKLERLQKLEQIEEQREKSNAGFFERVLETCGDFIGNVLSGAIKGLEGIYDFGASIVGGIGGIFDKDFQKSVKDHVAYDFTGNNITKPLNDFFDDSYLNDGKVGNFVKNVASGVGQMLPSVAMNILIPGSGMATMGVSATGGGTEQAFNDGAGYGQGMLYGAISGATEMVTEKLGGKLFGNTAIDDALGLKPTTKTLFKGAKTKLGKVAQEMISEGLEEGVAELVNPLTKMTYKGTESLKDYKDGEFWKGVGESAAVGAVTSAVFGGTIGQINRNTNKANETLSELRTLDVKEENLHVSDELFEGGNQTKIDNLRNKLRAELSESVVKMNDKTRVKYIQQNHLESILNEDGTLKPLMINSSQNTETISQDTKNGLASGVNRYMSVGLKGQEQNISERLKTQGVDIYRGNLTKAEQENYTKFKKTMLALSRKGLVNSNFVISEKSTKFDSYIDGNTIVVGKDMLESEEWQKKVIHEVEHFTEGSQEWLDFADFVMNETNLEKANADILSKGYGITQQDIDTLSQNLKNNSLTDNQQKYISEVMAHQSEYLFGNEQAIERLTATKKNLAQKILDRIKNFIKVLKAKSPEEKNFIKKLQQAESLFEKALNKAGTGYLVERAVDVRSKNEYNDNTKFAKKGYAKQDISTITRQSYNHHAWATNELTGILTSDEIGEFNNIIGEMKKGNVPLHETYDGNYLVEIGTYNKGEKTTIILTDGNFNGQSIDAVYKIYTDDINATNTIKEFIYERASTDAIGTMEESFNAYANTNEETGFREYTLESGKSFAEFSKQREYSKNNKPNNQSITNRTRNDSKTQFSLKPTQEANLKNRGVSGDNLLDCIDLAEEILSVGGEITPTAKVVLYHATTEENAQKIRETNQMYGKEPNLYFSTKKDGVIKDYGKAVVRVEIPLEKLKINDLFDDEAHLTMEVKPYKMTNIKFALKDSDIENLDKFVNEMMDNLTFEELMELADLKSEDLNISKPVPQLSKNERRELYVKKLYENNKLNDLITKIVKANPIMFEYFKNTKMNRKFDNLYPTKDDKFVVMFHGTPREFYNFDSSRIGTNGTQMGSGFYFTEFLEYANGYKGNEDGRIMATLLNIQKPLSRSKHEITKTQLKSFIKNVVDSTGENYLSNYGDVYSEGYENILERTADELIRYNSNDADMIEDIYITSRMDFDEFHDGLTKMLGYDGIIAWNKVEGTQAIVFKSNQIKDIFNYKPTSNSDIRYSLKQDSQGNKLTEQQAEYFKNSQVRDENGRLKTVYHGSPFQFTKFENKGSNAIPIYGQGHYFTDKLRTAKLYSGNSGEIYATYLNITNPYYATHKDEYWLNTNKLKEQGYDGVVADFGDEVHYVAFESNQIKETTNLNPTQNEDIRYALKSDGQLYKQIANNTKMKVYSKSEAEKLINELIDEQLNIKDMFGTLKGKSKEQAIQQMFVALNAADAGYRGKMVGKIADYIIENSIYESMYENDNSSEWLFQKETLKQYKGKLNLNSIKSEIYYKYDTNLGKAIIMQWGTKQDGMSVDTVPQELAEEGIFIDAINEAEIFFELVDMYNNASENLRNASKKIKSTYFSDGELKQLKQDLMKEILRGYDKYGSESKYANLVARYVDRINILKENLKDLKLRNKAINDLFATIDKVNGLEKFKSAEIELSSEVLGLVKLLKKVKTYRNNLSKNVREIMLKYSSDVDGKKLYDLISNSGDAIQNPVAQMIEDIAHANGELTTNEIRQLDLIMKNFIHNVKEYNRVFFEGKTQNDEEIVKQAIKETKEAISLKTNGFLGSMAKSVRWLTAPVWRFERLSSYRQDGIMSKIFGELQQGVDKQARFNMVVAEHFKKFFKDNKKVVQEWNKQTFDFNGTKISRGQAITLYMLFQRKQAVGHLLSNDGITGTIRITNEKHASKGNFKDALAEGVDVQIDYTTLDTIKNSLTDVEKEFIKLSKEFFDKISKDAKYETDMALYGISNVGEENYIPIRVADDQIYKQLGGNDISFAELFSVYNASFNKETKPNAKNKIVVENIIDIINRHSKQMASYYGLAVPLKTLNRLYNKKLEDGSKLSIEINKIDPEFERYLSKLLGDLQGRGNPRTTFDKVIGKIRGLGAKAALGLNLKVLANQFVSLPASHAVGVEYKNIMKGLAQAMSKKTNFDKLTEYCPMLYERFREGSNIDVGLLKEGQGVFGKVDALTDLTTAPIGKIDKFICGAVWNACLEQTKSNKYADFSDEHYKEAAKLTEKAVIKTQANYTALYRPAILREQNSFLQLSTMFMSEPLQQLSLLASSVDKMYVAKKLIKQNNSPENQALLKQAKAEAKAAITAVMVDAVLLTLIAQAFKWVKGQDDEENVLKSMTQEFTSNFIGMFPFIKDLYTMYQGYDVTNMAYTGLTNIYNAFSEMYNIVDLVASGKQYSDTEIRGKLRKVLLGLSQTFGIPLRNLETYTKGFIEKISPSAVYKYESLFYNNSMSNYSKELTKAIENNDGALADTIINVMLADKKIEVKDEKIRTVMRELFEEGLDVFPRSVGETIIHDGESIKLTKRQYENFKGIYDQANDKVSSLLNAKGFEDSPSVIKAKSIKYVYDYYYEEALKDLLGIDSDAKKYLFAQAIDITKLAMIVSQVSQIEADVDKNGKTISGSRKEKIIALLNSMNLTAVQKYMLMGYFGYKNSKGEQQVKFYIQSLKLTKTEKETLLSMCGY